MDAERPPRAADRFDRFTLDLARGALLAFDGAELPLRPKSFAWLRLFVENAGQLLGRDSIMAAIWPDVFVTDGSITRCVGEIRRAPGGAAPRLLRTLPAEPPLHRRGGARRASPRPRAPEDDGISPRPSPAPDLAGPPRASTAARAERRHR